jgi:cellulose synthase operon protein C
LALARLGVAKGEPPGGRAALAAMTDAVFASDAEGARARRTSESLRQAAVAGLVLLATKGAKAESLATALPVPDEDVDAESTLEQLVPKNLAPKDRAAAVVAFAEPLKKSAATALTTSTDRARAVLDAMGSRDGAFEPFLSASEDGPDVDAARAKAREIAAAIEPSVIALSRHPDAVVRTKAIVMLARSKSDGAATAIAEAVSDPNENVERVALASITHGDAKTSAAVAKVMRAHESWAMRVLAAQALGRVGGATPSLKEATSAQREPYALVREAALEALAKVDKPEAVRLAQTLMSSDPEPRVRETAKKIAGAK